MADRDNRPSLSPMPPLAAAIGQNLIDQLKPMLDAAFDDVAAMSGNSAERQNDALSIVAHVGAFVGLQLTARLMMTKRIDSETAMALASQDVANRMTAMFVDLLLGGQG